MVPCLSTLQPYVPSFTNLASRPASPSNHPGTQTDIPFLTKLWPSGLTPSLTESARRQSLNPPICQTIALEAINNQALRARVPIPRRVRQGNQVQALSMSCC